MTLFVVLHSCTREPLSPIREQSRQIPAPTFATGAVQDAPGVDMDLPPVLRPWDVDDDALIAALEQENGHAAVAFKLPGSPRVSETGGRRAAVPASAVEDGLELLRTVGAEVLHVYSFGAAHVRIDPALGPVLRQDPRVDYLEPRVWRQVDGTKADLAAIPDVVTPGISQTTPWGISLVRASEAWSVSTGSGVKVLVIDTGIDPHVDLPAIPAENCGGPFDGCTDEGLFHHGTHVAGIFLARDNTVGVIGVAHGVAAGQSLVYSWAAGNPQTGGFDQMSIADGIDAGRIAGVKVINMSFSGRLFSQFEANAVARADSAGIVMVASAGNVPDSDPGEIRYPAGYTNVVGVSGVRTDKSFASSSPCGGFSNHGPHVDLAGPFWALSTVDTNLYEDEDQNWCGNSMATPHVSGTAALLLAQNPTWTDEQVRDRLIATALDLGPSGWDNQFGFGLVDAGYAVGGIAPPPQPPQIASCHVQVESDGEWGMVWMTFATGQNTQSVAIMRSVNFGSELFHELIDTAPNTGGYSSRPEEGPFGTHVQFRARPFSGDDMTGTEGPSCTGSGGIERR